MWLERGERWGEWEERGGGHRRQDHGKALATQWGARGHFEQGETHPHYLCLYLYLYSPAYLSTSVSIHPSAMWAKGWGRRMRCQQTSSDVLPAFPGQTMWPDLWR